VRFEVKEKSAPPVSAPPVSAPPVSAQPVSAMSFLQKLKKTDEGILPYLKRIEENQTIIIDLLKQS
jgi:hypothetical protein